MAEPWACSSCGRSFRRVGQSHECAPAMTVYVANLESPHDFDDELRGLLAESFDL